MNTHSAYVDDYPGPRNCLPNDLAHLSTTRRRCNCCGWQGTVDEQYLAAWNSLPPQSFTSPQLPALKPTRKKGAQATPQVPPALALPAYEKHEGKKIFGELPDEKYVARVMKRTKRLYRPGIVLRVSNAGNEYFARAYINVRHDNGYTQVTTLQVSRKGRPYMNEVTELPSIWYWIEETLTFEREKYEQISKSWSPLDGVPAQHKTLGSKTTSTIAMHSFAPYMNRSSRAFFLTNHEFRETIREATGVFLPTDPCESFFSSYCLDAPSDLPSGSTTSSVYDAYINRPDK